MKPVLKRWLYVVAGLLLVGVLAWRVTGAMRSEVKPAAPPKRPPVSVEVGDVRHETIKDVQQLTGAVLPSYRYVVAPRGAGRILQITKRIGDRVSEGEVVARIDDSEYRQAVVEAEAALRSAGASLAEIRVQMELAARELERARELEARKIASRSELDKARADHQALESRLKLTEAQIEQREAALASAGIRLGYSVLTASRPGFVAERFVDEGSMLASNDAVISVVGLDPAIVRTTVVEKLYSRIRVGQEAEITVDAFPDRRFEGRIARISPLLQEASRVAEMEIEAPNAAHLLKPGMFARIGIVLSEKAAAQVVPTTAVVSRNGSTHVFVVARGQAVARLIPVQPGVATPAVTEILSPELDGQVVTLGHHLLQDGSTVIIPGSGEKGGK